MGLDHVQYIHRRMRMNVSRGGSSIAKSVSYCYSPSWSDGEVYGTVTSNLIPAQNIQSIHTHHQLRPCHTYNISHTTDTVYTEKVYFTRDMHTRPFA